MARQLIEPRQTWGAIRERVNMTVRQGGISILEHGGDPDGQADNTEAFERAQVAAVAAGSHVVYFPAGRYRGDFKPHPQISILGEPQQTILTANSPGGWALDFDRIQPPWMDQIWQRPFVRDIGIDGAGGTANGLRIWNASGVNLEMVAIHGCGTGLFSADNYYGLWEGLMIVGCDIGLNFAWAPDDGRHNPNGHTGNKTLVQPTIRLNRVGVLVAAQIGRTAFHGVTIEGNWACGLATDPLAADGPGWNVVNGLSIDGGWFEANGQKAGLGPLILSDGTQVPACELYVTGGTSVHMNLGGVSYAHVAAGGQLYAERSFVGRGPANAFLTVEPGGTFKHALSVVPAAFDDPSYLLY